MSQHVRVSHRVFQAHRDRDTTHNWTLGRTTRFKCAGCATAAGTGLGTPNNRFHKSMPETLLFSFTLVRHTAGSTAAHMKPFLRMRVELHRLSGSTLLDELSIAFRFMYPNSPTHQLESLSPQRCATYHLQSP